jgi:hypothetical protein
LVAGAVTAARLVSGWSAWTAAGESPLPFAPGTRSTAGSVMVWLLEVEIGASRETFRLSV